MRYRLMASYQDSPFEAGIGPTEQDVVLFAACPPPEELGFEPATGHWRKQLRLSDVQAVWESRPVGMFRGERCTVLDDLGDRLHIGYLGHDGFQAERLGYWQVDRGVFELVAPRAEVSEIIEERVEHAWPDSHHHAPGGLPAAQPAWPASPAAAGPAPWDAPEEVTNPGEPPRWSTAEPAADVRPGPDRSDSREWAAAAPIEPAPGRSAAAALAPSTAPLPLSAAPPGAPLVPSSAPPVVPSSAPPVVPSPAPPVAFLPALDEVTGVALPPSAGAPLPLEAEAWRAASAARSAPPAARSATALLDTSSGQLERPRAAPERQRLPSERLFTDLATQAGIPADRYSIGTEVEGALCLLPDGAGFQVFRSASGSRRELHAFATEEAACFYLFGVLAAEAIRTGSLVTRPGR